MGILLSDCENKKFFFKFGNTQLYLRFDMEALLRLEKLNIDLYKGLLTEEQKRTAFCAGLKDCLAEMDVDEQYVYEIADILKDEELGRLIEGAVLLSLPEPVVGAKPKPGKTDFVQLFSLFCDIMGKPDELFWKSTVREIIQRWEKYAEINGYKKPAEKVKEFEDE